MRTHEVIDDDHVIPDAFDMRWVLDLTQAGSNVPRRTIKDAQGVETGYEFIHPVKDLASDLEKLPAVSCRVDRDQTASRRAFLEELFDGVLGVRPTSGVPGSRMLTQRVIQLMGMEAFFMAMYDCPDALHALMGRLRDDTLTVMRWAEAEGLLILNNGNDVSFGSSCNFTTRLPAAGGDGGAVRLADMWGDANSQETVGISAELFHEFCFPYYRDVCEPLGLLYYGCCEPAHPFWDDIRRLPHLKKVSISRWCDQRLVGESLRGGEVVFSRKPDPKFFAVDVELDEEAWSAHVRETLEAADGVGIEFIVRDVYTVHGNLDKPRRAVELARREIERAGR